MENQQDPSERNYNWENGLWRNYHMSYREYKERLEAQGGVCLICKLPPHKEKPLIVDHKHSKIKPQRLGKRIRGLLHSNCNAALGFLKDNPKWCRNAAEYLEADNERLYSIDSV